jgi:hypothetical protein
MLELLATAEGQISGVPLCGPSPARAARAVRALEFAVTGAALTLGVNELANRA